MKKAAAALVLAIVTLLAPAAHAIDVPPTREESSTSQLRGAVRRVVIDSNGGDVIVNAGTPSSVKKTERWAYQRPSVRMSFSRGVLTITSRCPTLPLNNCRVNFSAFVTPTAVVEVATGNGLIRISHISSSLVTGTTNNGNIRLSHVGADTVRAVTANGIVGVRLNRAPVDARLRSSNGDIAAVVPRGTYTLDVGTRSGNIHISGISNRRNSGHRLLARTNNGDITIAGN